MSTSGRLQTNLSAGLKMTFDYSYTINKSARTATVNWYISPLPYSDPSGDAGNAHYHLAKSSQKLTIKWKHNGSSQSYTYNKGDSYTSSGHTVYKGYCDAGSSLDQAYNGKEFYDTNGNWTGIKRWVKILGTKWLSGSFTVDYNNSGEAEFYVKGDFAWWNPSNPQKRMTFEKTVQLDKISKAFKVTYNANGGTGAPSSQLKIVNQTLKLSTKTPTLSGFKFKGWGTSTTDTSVNYKAGGNYTANKAITLYAIWGHDITYKPNSGQIVGGSTQTKYSKTSIKLFANNKVKRTGYLLNGWATQSLMPVETNNIGTSKKIISGVTIYPPNATFNDNNITTLYAYYRYQSNIPITLKEYYSKNEKVADKQITVMYDHNIPSNTRGVFTSYWREGYELLGWSKQKTEVFTITPSTQQLSSLLFDYNAKYTDSTSGIVLYPVLKYSTTCYVNVNNTWKLAIPYVNVNGQWKQAMMYGNQNNNWKL